VPQCAFFFVVSCLYELKNSFSMFGKDQPKKYLTSYYEKVKGWQMYGKVVQILKNMSVSFTCFEIRFITNSLSKF